MNAPDEVKQANHESSIPESKPASKGRLPCLVQHGVTLEDFPPRTLWVSNPAEYNKQYYQVNARNALRHLTYGQPLFKQPYWSKSNLRSAWINFKSLFIKRDQQHLYALRDELKNIFENAYEVLQDCDAETEERLEIFLNTLISNLPFLDPQDNEAMFIPKKIDGRWLLVPYLFKKIDISPHSGWLSRLIEDEDRLYAWGLEPQVPEADPYLLLMGTSYLSGQGAHFSLLGDLSAGQSVGEPHDLTHLECWIRERHNIIVSGHSQGGSMAMIVAGKFPDHVRQAFALNPAALLRSTIDKLKQTWDATKTQIYVYIQERDPVFIFGQAFLPGTRFFHVTHPESKIASLFSAHVHHFLGFLEANYEEIYDPHLQYTNSREFWNKVKAAADKIFGPLVIVHFAYQIIKRKLLRFCYQHRNALRTVLFLTLLAASVAMIASGILTIPGLMTLDPAIHIGILALGTTAVSATGTALLPILAKCAIYCLELTIGSTITLIAGTYFTLNVISAGFGALVRSFSQKNPEQDSKPQNESTQRSLSHLKDHPDSRTDRVLPYHKEIVNSSMENNRSENGRAHTLFAQPNLQPNSPLPAPPQAQHKPQCG